MAGTREYPFLSVWLRPSRTVARIAHENPGYGLYTLPIAAGFAVWPTHVVTGRTPGATPDGILLASLLSFSPLLEILQLVIGAWLLQQVGIRLGGRAGVGSLQTVIAWSNVPIVGVALLALAIAPVALLFGDEGGTPGLPTGFPMARLAVVAAFTAQCLLVGWSLVIFVRGLARVQGFSLRRACFCGLVAWSIFALVTASALVAIGHGEDLQHLFFGGIADLLASLG